MNKRIVTVITTLAVTAFTVVPAFASPTSEFEAAAAAQKVRSERLATDKENLISFQSSQLAQSDAQRAAGEAEQPACTERCAEGSRRGNSGKRSGISEVIPEQPA